MSEACPLPDLECDHTNRNKRTQRHTASCCSLCALCKAVTGNAATCSKVNAGGTFHSAGGGAKTEGCAGTGADAGFDVDCVEDGAAVVDVEVDVLVTAGF